MKELGFDTAIPAFVSVTRDTARLTYSEMAVRVLGPRTALVFLTHRSEDDMKGSGRPAN
jgi:hypothetical protein